MAVDAPALQVRWPDQPRLRWAFAILCLGSASGVLFGWWESHQRWGWVWSSSLDGSALLALSLCAAAAWALPVWKPLPDLLMRWDGQRWFLVDEGHEREAQVRPHLDAGLAVWVSVSIASKPPAAAAQADTGLASGVGDFVSRKLRPAAPVQRHWRWVSVAPENAGHALRCALYSSPST
jgi:hypothetical protein